MEGRGERGLEVEFCPDSSLPFLLSVPHRRIILPIARVACVEVLGEALVELSGLVACHCVSIVFIALRCLARIRHVSGGDGCD